ncbi:chromate transporter [Alkalicoccobacillus murimartini]|uniref:Chromate transporter n=1 Tax=Alkalicoccobacillus murimartini TaxID=171685 RepID=A0ABT9YKC2_9BACI|nr:chromate transporter [Alkalicoccobacillus murimartini]MDQ0208312.1 chromate transporter [Alkalicoccobacillus murimartini]
MVYIQLFIAFFIPGIVGYGGGPPSIPLIQNEVVNRYGWMTNQDFSELVALGNALPGPIATKLAGQIGYEVAGIPGAAVALFAMVAPTVLLMIVLLNILLKYKDSPKIKLLTKLIKPTIAILLGVLAYDFFAESWGAAGAIQTVILIVASFLLLEKFKVHPAFVILGSLLYGAIFLG